MTHYLYVCVSLDYFTIANGPMKAYDKRNDDKVWSTRMGTIQAHRVEV